MDDTGVIVAAVIVTVGSGYIATIADGKVPAFNSFLAGGFMGMFLFAIASVNSQLARQFAILIIIGVLLRNGDAVFGWTTRVSSAQAKQTVSATTPNPNQGVIRNA
jgi:hypothetical protein